MAKAQKEESFLSDVKELRRRARQHMEEGAVTPGYLADREKVISVLNEALATEIVCVLRYKRHYFMATGIHAQAVAEEFLQHANDEQGHADQSPAGSRCSVGSRISIPRASPRAVTPNILKAKRLST